MIAHRLFFFILLIVLPDLYIDYRFVRRRSWWKRLIWWLPSVFMIVYTVKLAKEPNFMPDDPNILYTYLFLLGLIVIPKASFALCSALGKGWCSAFRKRRNYGNLVGLLSIPTIWYILIYGSFIGSSKLVVQHIEYASSSLPKAFDGYRIVMFSDAHVGTYTKDRQWQLKRVVDSINVQHPDLIVYLGDLQNMHPQELYLHRDLLSTLRAKDGVFSVLGNHDYAEYVSCDEVQKVANVRETVGLERQMGWTPLLNEHRTIQRHSSYIVVAGMENEGDSKRSPKKGDINKTLKDVAEGAFILMLEHDPSAWRRMIIPDGRCQLTLSGHTHNMQFSLFGWSPLSALGKEINGWYQEKGQSLYITAGVGGVVPFRFGATGEIVVLTLKAK